ncbi:hypothetical protein HK102_006097, partial [Quaeritorhiza haematococci]
MIGTKQTKTPAQNAAANPPQSQTAEVPNTPDVPDAILEPSVSIDLDRKYVGISELTTLKNFRQVHRFREVVIARLTKLWSIGQIHIQRHVSCILREVLLDGLICNKLLENDQLKGLLRDLLCSVDGEVIAGGLECVYRLSRIPTLKKRQIVFENYFQPLFDILSMICSGKLIPNDGVTFLLGSVAYLLADCQEKNAISSNVVELLNSMNQAHFVDLLLLLCSKSQEQVRRHAYITFSFLTAMAGVEIRRKKDAADALVAYMRHPNLYIRVNTLGRIFSTLDTVPNRSGVPDDSKTRFEKLVASDDLPDDLCQLLSSYPRSEILETSISCTLEETCQHRDSRRSKRELRQKDPCNLDGAVCLMKHTMIIDTSPTLTTSRAKSTMASSMLTTNPDEPYLYYVAAMFNTSVKRSISVCEKGLAICQRRGVDKNAFFRLAMLDLAALNKERLAWSDWPRHPETTFELLSAAQKHTEDYVHNAAPDTPDLRCKIESLVYLTLLVRKNSDFGSKATLIEWLDKLEKKLKQVDEIAAKVYGRSE